ncbi:hypothetical protein FDH01_gp317 [Acinetobacter phage vB_AbaM_ME3]|uniref:Uncharacterized protein n=1 Tax=Acinetobacter phage vB_AbaM_ME3 TaxID=1837876 RepID=A0A172Q0D5_9CAUD|nr:hypothetical protein FDH01_gp317 [Acinetobacter phage vB_AbaM_ME3]AND75305.1 hypothetical protein ME3_144 [Acinetobacter phage vB_AbaM_ME3]
MQKQLANFKRSLTSSNILYSSSTIEPQIIDYFSRDYSLKETIIDYPERYILFVYESSLTLRVLKTHSWTRFVWIFDKETKCRLRIKTSSLSYVEENYSPSKLEIY